MPPPVTGQPVHFVEAIKAAAERKVVLPDVYYGQLQGVARQQAFSIAGVASFDQLQAVKDSLDKAIASGQTFASWQREAAVKDLGLSKNRLDIIFRNNVQGAYMAGRWEQIERTKHRRPYVMYDAINDSRVRPNHLAMDGIIRLSDDPFWEAHKPPNGHRCRCSVIQLSESQALARSKDGKGLNKPIDEVAMKPDEGWDYSPRDRLHGVEQAIVKRQEKGGVLVEALKSELSSVLSSPVVKLPATNATVMTDWKQLNLPSAKELRKNLSLSLPPELIHGANNQHDALALLRAELAINVGEKRTLTTPVGDVLLDDLWLAHIVEKRDAARERYAKWIIPTLKQPTEVWLSDYENEELRKRYIKLFAEGDKQMLVVISVLQNLAIWNAIPMPLRSLDNQRVGELLWKGY